MLRNSIFSIWNTITLDNEPSPEDKKISSLNNSVQLIKEMDGANNVEQIDAAITRLEHWKNTRQQQNNILSIKELKEKQAILNEALSKFNFRFYSMMICTIANTVSMSAVAYFALMSDISIGKKSLAIGASGIGIVEGSIHLYKAKRFFVQKYQITKVELDSVNQAIRKHLVP